MCLARNVAVFVKSGAGMNNELGDSCSRIHDAARSGFSLFLNRLL